VDCQSHVNLVDDKVFLDAFFDKLLLGNTVGETVFDSSPEIDRICLIKTVVDYFGYAEFVNFSGDSVQKHRVHWRKYEGLFIMGLDFYI
jgi:hypothetical protein